MANLLEDDFWKRNQHIWSGLLGLSQGLAQAGAPSPYPQSFVGGLGAAAGGFAQGVDAYRAQQQDRELMDLRRQEAQMRQAEFDRQNKADADWRGMFTMGQPQTAQVGPTRPDQPRGYQTATNQPQSPFANLTPTQRALLGMADQKTGLGLLAQWMEPQEGPSGVQEYEYAKSQGFAGSLLDYEKAKAEAGRAPQQPLATNLITLVAPDGKALSVDSRDPRINELLAQGYVERQTSMFPAAPSGYSYSPDGLTAIPGGPADPANPNNLSVDQRKVGSFAQRLQSANAIIDQTESAGTSYGEAIKGAVPFIGNALLSPERQQLEQAQRDFVNAQLRRESGATIQDTEFENAKRQYFPQPGDTPEVIAQKRESRKLAVQNMQREAGPALAQPGQSGGSSVVKELPPGFE